MPEPKRCAEIIYGRDTLRYTGRGPGGFSMHHTRKRCGRYVKATDEHCWQHRRAVTAARPDAGRPGEG